MPPKRKATAQAAPPAKRQQRSTHFQDARQIAAQTSETAYGNGELDINKFLKAQDFAMKSLETGMQKSRNSLNSRAFQKVPRDLRRRTASHNVKRVPKRLQSRARREMQQDNTPTVTSKTRKPSGHDRLRREVATQKKRSSAASKKRREMKTISALASGSGPVPVRMPHMKADKLAKPPRPKAKFKKRQVNKTWLPTHMWHTKRARMTAPDSPLWRMAIPLEPTQKGYRPTHRAANARSAIAWDMSYVSTISLYGTEDALIVLMQSFGVGGPDLETSWWSKTKSAKFLKGKRSWTGLVHEPFSDPHDIIAPVTIIWNPIDALHQPTEGQKRPKRQAFVRVHPAAFKQLWDSLLKVSKTQKPKIAIEDLRFEIGSIEVMGPSAAEALVGVLQPVDTAESPTGKAASTWTSIRSISNPGVMPAGAILGLDVADPRLSYPHPKRKTTGSAEEMQALIRLLHDWPPDDAEEPVTMFDRAARIKASRSLPSQKSVNRRKGAAAPGAVPDALPTDPCIPTLVIASRSHSTQAQGSLTVLLPWKCIKPVWHCLMHYPLYSGGNIRFGGLDQKRQLTLEAGSPWFPGDFPGTKAGMLWEEQERTTRNEAWQKRPKSKRVNWDSLLLGAKRRRGEIGKGWASDWEALNVALGKDSAAELQQCRMFAARQVIDQLSSTALCDGPSPMNEQSASTKLATVEIRMVSKGTPSDCGRVYRLPTTDANVRVAWMSTIEAGSTKRALAEKNTKTTGQPSDEDAATWLLPSNTSIQEPAPDLAVLVPDEADLIGFVTTGSYNLSHGKGSCLANIAIEQLRPHSDQNLCIVRESGASIGRIARWHLVD